MLHVAVQESYTSPAFQKLRLIKVLQRDIRQSWPVYEFTLFGGFRRPISDEREHLLPKFSGSDPCSWYRSGGICTRAPGEELSWGFFLREMEKWKYFVAIESLGTKEPPIFWYLRSTICLLHEEPWRPVVIYMIKIIGPKIIWWHLKFILLEYTFNLNFCTELKEEFSRISMESMEAPCAHCRILLKKLWPEQVIQT